MGLLNLSSGLAAFGGAVSDFGGHAALDALRSQLDEDRIRLADSLAGSREETGDLRRAGIAETAATVANTRNIEKEGREEGYKVAAERRSLLNHRELGDIDLDLTVNKAKKMATPEMLDATRAITMASTAPSNSLHFTDDGSAILMDGRTGKTKPLLGPDDKPIRLTDPDQIKLATAAFTSVRDERRMLETNFNTRLDSANAELKNAGFDEEKATAARARIKQIETEYNAQKSDLDLRARQPEAILEGLMRNRTPGKKVDDNAAPSIQPWMRSGAQDYKKNDDGTFEIRMTDGSIWTPGGKNIRPAPQAQLDPSNADFMPSTTAQKPSAASRVAPQGGASILNSTTDASSTPRAGTLDSAELELSKFNAIHKPWQTKANKFLDEFIASYMERNAKSSKDKMGLKMEAERAADRALLEWKAKPGNEEPTRADVRE